MTNEKTSLSWYENIMSEDKKKPSMSRFEKRTFWLLYSIIAFFLMVVTGFTIIYSIAWLFLICCAGMIAMIIYLGMFSKNLSRKSE